MKSQYYGVFLIILGIIYIIKPDIFRRGIWKKTAVTQQIFSPKNYCTYMRILGCIFIVIGLWLCLKHTLPL